MKRLFALLLCLMILCCFAGCHLGKQNKDVVDENFYCKVIDGSNIAIGNVKTYPRDGAVFFPERIQNYTVSKIGFASGMGFGGNGVLTTIKEDEPNIKRCYFPHTIKEIRNGYMSGNLKVFYCGEIINLGHYARQRGVEIYIPAEKYELFENALSENYRGSLLKADVSYYLNYDENNYYYVDYYENGGKILYIPPEPQRDDYSFVGWFKEADCVNRWDFDADTLQIAEKMQEIKLFAKWESVDK